MYLPSPCLARLVIQFGGFATKPQFSKRAGMPRSCIRQFARPPRPERIVRVRQLTITLETLNMRSPTPPPPASMTVSAVQSPAQSGGAQAPCLPDPTPSRAAIKRVPRSRPVVLFSENEEHETPSLGGTQVPKTLTRIFILS